MDDTLNLKIGPFRTLQKDPVLATLANSVSIQIREMISKNEYNKKNKLKSKKKTISTALNHYKEQERQHQQQQQPPIRRKSPGRVQHNDSDFDFVDDDTIF